MPDNPSEWTDSEWKAQAVAYLLGELNRTEAEAFEQLLAESAMVRLYLHETRQTLHALKTLPSVPSRRDLAPEVLRALQADVPQTPLAVTPRVPRWGRRLGKAAAAALLVLGGLVALFGTREMPGMNPVGTSAASTKQETTASQGRDWLLAMQTSSGAWTPAGEAAPDRHTIGLTALAVFALAAENTSPGPNSETLDALRRAGLFLTAQLTDPPSSRRPHRASDLEHAMAASALLEIQRLAPFPELGAGIEKIWKNMTPSEEHDGGLSYRPRISEWPPHGAGRRGANGWLAGVESPSEDNPASRRPGSHALPFALQKIVREVQIDLLRAQQPPGDDPVRRRTAAWSHLPGGRITATALATLALAPAGMDPS